MTQKAPKEEVLKLLAEFTNRESNIKTIELLQNFLATVHVAGRMPTADLHRCFQWLEGIAQGEAARVDEIRKLLPDHDEVIEPSKPSNQPQDAAQVVPPENAPTVSVGEVELEKGSPVLGAV